MTDLAAIVMRAAQAPSVHNIQPARWALRGDAILIGCDLSVTLPAGDPTGHDAALSVGAAVEATAIVTGGTVEEVWDRDDRVTFPGCRLAARVVPGAGPTPDADLLDRRFTWRGAFGPTDGVWPGHPDIIALTGAEDRAWIAALQDRAGLAQLRQGPVRRELLHWMRLSPRHPRWGIDGMHRPAMNMGAAIGVAAGLFLGPLWPLFDAVGLTGTLTAEAKATRTAPVIGCFHRPAGENPVTTGRAYLRACLAATALGWAMWPMAALTDDPAARAEITARIAVPKDRRLVQVIRFGPPTGPMPPRARRPLSELILPG